IATLLFAVHPMRVESVVWITERKDVLFGAFYLAAILNYLKYKVDKSKLRLISIYILFLLSLLSKVQAVMLPLSLICFDYYYDKRIEIKQFLTKFPMFLFSLFFGLLAIYLLKEYGSIDSNDQFTGISRIFIGSYSLLVYLVKSILPFRLSPLYPYPSELNWVFYASIFIFPLYIFALYKSYRNKDTVYFFGLSFFLVNIFMLLQILGAGQGFIADRFTYIAYLGLFIIYAQLIQTLLDKYPKKKLVISIGMAGIMAIYAMMSFNQTKIWKDSGTLWSHVLKYYQNITLPYGNRANFYRDEGMKKEALADYNNAISLKPSAATYNSRARLYFDSGNNRDTIILALNDYNKAIEIEEDKSKIGEYYVNRGATWARLGDLDKSIEDLNMGLKLKPDQLSGYINRSIMYRSKGDYKNSLEDIKTYLKFNPNSADIWYEKGILERYFKNTQEALNNFNQAIRIDDNKAIYYYGRSQAWYDLQNIDNARKDFNMSLAKGFDKYDSNYRNLLGI
nr:tetratricopeptide repeat protein [Saprospiraceae bacterium]